MPLGFLEVCRRGGWWQSKVKARGTEATMSVYSPHGLFLSTVPGAACREAVGSLRPFSLPTTYTWNCLYLTHDPDRHLEPSMAWGAVSSFPPHSNQSSRDSTVATLPGRASTPRGNSAGCFLGLRGRQRVPNPEKPTGDPKSAGHQWA
jgi:hypothetical protein